MLGAPALLIQPSNIGVGQVDQDAAHASRAHKVIFWGRLKVGMRHWTAT